MLQRQTTSTYRIRFRKKSIILGVPIGNLHEKLRCLYTTIRTSCEIVSNLMRAAKLPLRAWRPKVLHLAARYWPSQTLETGYEVWIYR